MFALQTFGAQAENGGDEFPYNAYDTIQFCVDIPEQEQYLKRYLTQLYPNRKFIFLNSDVNSSTTKVTYMLVLQGRYSVSKIAERCPFLPKKVLGFLEGPARKDYLQLREMLNIQLRSFNKRRREEHKNSGQRYSGDFSFIETCISVNSEKDKGQVARDTIGYSAVIFDRNFKCPQNFGGLTSRKGVHAETFEKLKARTKVIFGDDRNGYKKVLQ